MAKSGGALEARRIGWRLRLSGASILLVVLTSCASSNVESQPVAELLPTVSSSAGTSSPALNFPLEAYQLSLSELRLLDNASLQLTADCAKKRGIVYDPGTSSKDQGYLDRQFFALYEASIRPTSVPKAQALGYHPPQSPVPPDPIDNLPLDEVTVVQGWYSSYGTTKPTDPFLLDGGCIGQVARQLDESNDQLSLNDAIRTVSDIVGATQARVLSDPILIGLVRSWSECMGQNGYPGVQSFRDAQATYSLAGPVHDDERTEAVQDAKCKEKVGYLDQWQRLTTAYEDDVIEQNFQTLTNVRQAYRNALRVAASQQGG